MTSSLSHNYSIMEGVVSSCSCPFCTPNSSFLTSLSGVKTSWRIYFIIFLLLFGGCNASRLRAIRDVPAAASNDEGLSHLSTINNAQKFNFKASELPDCVSSDNCSCQPVGKCRRCSRIDINRQLPECMLTGYKQRSFCLNVKRERFTSCHFVENPRDANLFFLFEGSMISLGVLSYAITILRIRKMEHKTARRIQDQINA